MRADAVAVTEGRLCRLDADARTFEGNVEPTMFGTCTKIALDCCAMATEE